MSKRWMKSVNKAAEGETQLPWGRGKSRAHWKAAARARALAG